MKALSTRLHWKISTAPAALVAAAAVLGLGLACASTGAAKPQAPPPPGPSATATAPKPPAAPVAPAQAQAQAGAKPTLEAVGGETFSFGAFWPGSEPLKHSFVLKNTGDAERKILRVQPG